MLTTATALPATARPRIDVVHSRCAPRRAEPGLTVDCRVWTRGDAGGTCAGPSRVDAGSHFSGGSVAAGRGSVHRGPWHAMTPGRRSRSPAMARQRSHAVEWMEWHNAAGLAPAHAFADDGGT
jgi:hypothetical protein